MKFALAVLIQSLFFSSAFGADLNTVLTNYQTKPFAEIAIEKKVISELFSTEKTYLGNLSITKGKFRLDIQQPEVSTILFDGVAVWSIHGNIKNPKTAAISKFVVPKNSNKGLLLGQIFYSRGLGPSLKIVGSEKRKDGKVLYTLKVSDPTLSIDQLQISADLAKKSISEISYNDEVGNKTVLVFKKSAFKTKVPNQWFEFHPPKDLKVEEL